MWLPQPSISNYLSSIIIKWIIKCRVFNHGMDCVNKYVQECIDSKQIVENSVYGAKKLFEYLCKEKYFQQGGKQTAQFHKVNANDGQMISLIFRVSPPQWLFLSCTERLGYLQ